MNNMIARTYNKLYRVNMNLNLDGIESIGAPYELSRLRKYNNKLLVFKAEECKLVLPYNPIQILKKYTSCTVGPNSILYVHPGCKIPRELLRNSGYKITINRDNADYIVLPYKEDCIQISVDIMASKDDDVYIFNCPDTNICIANECTIKDALTSLGYSNIIFGSHIKNRAFFIANYDIYKEALESVDGNVFKNFIFEYDIPIEYPVNISVETLNLWKNIKDKNMWNKLLLSSDCYKYPKTTFYFINKYWTDLYTYSSNRSEPLKRLFSSMSIELDMSVIYNLSKGDVTPDDWNMLTRLILSSYNLPDTGGFVDHNLVDEYDLMILRNKFALAPKFIDKTTNLNCLIYK